MIFMAVGGGMKARAAPQLQKILNAFWFHCFWLLDGGADYLRTTQNVRLFIVSGCGLGVVSGPISIENAVHFFMIFMVSGAGMGGAGAHITMGISINSVDLHVFGRRDWARGRPQTK